MDAELAYAGTEPEEGEAEDGAEQGHGCRMIWASLGQMVRTSPDGESELNPFESESVSVWQVRKHYRINTGK